MQTRRPIMRPVEFITVTIKSKKRLTYDRGTNRDGLATESLILSYDSKSDNNFSDEHSDDLISSDGSSSPPWPLTGAKDMSSSLSISVCQPSLSRTFDSDSSCLVSNTTSNNEPSKIFDKNAKKVPSLECLYHTLYPKCIDSSVPAIMYTHENLRRRTNRPSIVTCESTAVTSTTTSNELSLGSQRTSQSSRIDELKHTLRSIELQHYRRKRPLSERSMVQSTNTSALHDSGNSLSSGFYLSRYNNIFGVEFTIQRLMEAVWEILFINTLLYMVYLLFMFYTYSLSMFYHSFQ